ncbi:MAG: class I SAM-dependent methyltransferase [Gammaproteobacteria bacterium]|nr:class I SAM-dependent methyltransferase [Gammaproteobacteria bacterium]
MSIDDKTRWNTRYASGEYQGRRHANPLLEEWLERLPHAGHAGRRALDVACGAGRNALYLAAAGYQVDAVDISGEALARAEASARERGLSLHLHELDLDDADLPGGDYDLILVSRYLNRDLFPALVEALADDGFLIYDTHLLTDVEVGGPGTSRFRLRPQELLHLCHALRIVYYREGLIQDRDGKTMALAQVVACKGHPGF